MHLSIHVQCWPSQTQSSRKQCQPYLRHAQLLLSYPEVNHRLILFLMSPLAVGPVKTKVAQKINRRWVRIDWQDPCKQGALSIIHEKCQYSSIFQNFQKEDYLAKYTEFFGNFLLGISVQFDFAPEISRTFSWLVFIMEIQQLYTFPCINVNHSLKIISSLYCAVSAP